MVEQGSFSLSGDSWEPGQRLLKFRVAEAVKAFFGTICGHTSLTHFRSGFHSKLTETFFNEYSICKETNAKDLYILSFGQSWGRMKQVLCGYQPQSSRAERAQGTRVAVTM